MGMIWQILGHIWPICGSDMGRLGDHKEFIWDQIFAWEGKPMIPTVWESYGDRMPSEIPYH